MNIFKSKVVAISLAIAMTFSVIATPIANAASAVTTTDEAAQFLSEVGLLQGDGNGDLMLDSNLTREQATVAMSRLLGVETEAEVYATDGLTFTDVADEYYAPFVAWAQDNGLVQGYSETEFGYGDQLTAWQTMALFVRALGYTDTADDQIATVAAELGITANSTAEEQAPISRGDMALLMYNTINAKTVEGTVLGEDLGVLDAEVATDVTYTASAATVDTIKVVFNTAVDTTKATIAVVKDDVTAKVANVTWNDAKTEASLEMSIDLTEGDYVVTVAGIEVKTASATVTVKDEETAKIEFTTDKAIQDGNDVYTYVKVSNQYGQDITEDASIKFTATNANGLVTLDGETGIVTIPGLDATTYEVDDVITVTALDEESGAFATAKLTVAEAAAADTVEIVNLYNDDEDADFTVGTEGYELLLKVKDQYGNEMTDEALVDDGLLVSSSSESRVALATPAVAASHVTVDEVDYMAVPLTLVDEGTSTIRFISRLSGKTVSKSLEVLPAAEVDTITFTAPARVVAGEENKFAVTATDENGNAVTDLTKFNAVQLSAVGVTIDAADMSFKKEAGKVILSVNPIAVPQFNLANIFTDDAKTNEYKSVEIMAITATNNVVRKAFKLYEQAVPTTVSKLIDVKTGMLIGADAASTIELSDDEDVNNVEILDQYGRAMDWSDVAAVSYTVTISSEDADVTTTNVDADTKKVTGVQKGSAVVTLTLKDGAADVIDTLDFTANVVELADIQSYEVADVDTVYAPDLANHAYDVDVDVYGVLSNGTKVTIPASMYSIVSGTTGLDLNAGKLYAVAGASGVEFATDSKTATGTIAITIGGATGPVDVTKTVNISKVAPVASSYELEDGVYAPVTVNNGELYVDAASLTDATALEAVLTVKDQYDVAYTTDPVSVIYSNKVDADETDEDDLTLGDQLLTLTNAATLAGSTVEYADADDTFTVTFVYANGYKVTVNVNVQ